MVVPAQWCATWTVLRYRRSDGEHRRLFCDPHWDRLASPSRGQVGPEVRVLRFIFDGGKHFRFLSQMAHPAATIAALGVIHKPTGRPLWRSGAVEERG
jgi:hypothetical protein